MTVNEEGLKALQEMASALRNAPGRMLDATESVRSLSDAEGFALGPHKDMLDAVLYAVADAARQSEEPAKILADYLDEVADWFLEVITTDRLRKV